jgi:tetratricopeptide (TPR) repeat protein
VCKNALVRYLAINYVVSSLLQRRCNQLSKDTIYCCLCVSSNSIKGQYLIDSGYINFVFRYLSTFSSLFGSALYHKGNALYALENYTGAVLYYDKALAIQPNDTYTLDGKGADLKKLGNYTGAVFYYNKALARDPKDTFALTNKAAIHDILAGFKFSIHLIGACRNQNHLVN